MRQTLNSTEKGVAWLLGALRYISEGAHAGGPRLVLFIFLFVPVLVPAALILGLGQFVQTIRWRRKSGR
jgi:hypothetical protein